MKQLKVLGVLVLLAFCPLGSSAFADDGDGGNEAVSIVSTEHYTLQSKEEVASQAPDTKIPLIICGCPVGKIDSAVISVNQQAVNTNYKAYFQNIVSNPARQQGYLVTVGSNRNQAVVLGDD
jgi:hypothetical protein